MTFAQNMKNRLLSNTLPMPISGPHLFCTVSPFFHQGYGKESEHLPILDIRTASESMANDHDIITVLVELAPGFVSDGDVAECSPRLERKFGDHMNRLTINKIVVHFLVWLT